MYYQEKRTIVGIAEGIALLAAYCIYVTGKLNAGAATLDDLKFFAVAMLTFIGIGIVLAIVIQIVFHILFSVSIAVRERNNDEKQVETAINAAMVEDERDKIIDLKSTRIPFIVSMVGFIAGLVLVALEYPAAVMLNILFIAASLGSIGEGVAKLIYYKAGVRNG
ncbi:MAG: hypothetical protein ABIG45_06640 [Bacillota bacterium]